MLRTVAKTKPPPEIRDRIIGLQRVRAGDLIPSKANWRTHNKAQAGALGAVLREVGWSAALIARKVGSKLELIDGHLRAGVAPDAKVPVLVLDVTAAEADKLLATMDPIGAMAGKNQEALAELLAKVKTEDEDLRRMLADLGGPAALKEGATDPDEIPDSGWHRKGKIKRGAVYLLGKHRIICGDSTNSEDVARVLGTAKPEIMVTDPPYGVEYDPAWREEVGLSAPRATGKVAADDRADWTPAWRLFDGSVAYCWHSDRHASIVQDGLESEGFEIRCQVIWAKQNFPISRGAYHWQHEPCWYAVRKGSNAAWCRGRKQTTLWTVSTVAGFGAGDDEADRQVGKGDGLHSTQKPAELFRRPLQNHRCSSVYEPFAGSGTCIIAAEQTGKSCLAIEIEPKYVGVAIERWRRFSGREPERG